MHIKSLICTGGGTYWKVCFIPFVFTSDLKMVVDLALEREKVIEKNEQRKEPEKAKTKTMEVTKERIHKSTINNYHKRLVLLIRNE